MKKKAKLFASLSSLCLALAVLCFGVYAAQTVNYTANGSVTYDVTDVFVKVETKLYWSTSESPTTDVQTPANALKNGGALPANTALATTYTGTPYSTYEDGTIKNPGETVTAESGALPINYGKYEASGTKSYAYYIVVEITNYGTDRINAVLTNNTTATTLNSIIYETESIEIVGRGTETSKVGRIVVGMALKDVTKSASGDFSYSVQISKGELPVTTKLTFTPNDTGYSVAAANKRISGEIVIPETYNGKSVTTIAEEAFYDCTGITKITLPNTITSIETNAFSGCTGLTEFTIPESVTEIGRGQGRVFKNCTNISSITIPKSVASMGYAVFWGWKENQTINLAHAYNGIPYVPAGAPSGTAGWDRVWNDLSNANIVFGTYIAPGAGGEIIIIPPEG